MATLLVSFWVFHYDHRWRNYKKSVAINENKCELIKWEMKKICILYVLSGVRRRCRRRRDALMSEKSFDVFRVGENLLALLFHVFNFHLYRMRIQTNARALHATIADANRGKVLFAFIFYRRYRSSPMDVWVSVGCVFGCVCVFESTSCVFGERTPIALYLNSIHLFYCAALVNTERVEKSHIIIASFYIFRQFQFDCLRQIWTLIQNDLIAAKTHTCARDTDKCRHRIVGGTVQWLAYTITMRRTVKRRRRIPKNPKISFTIIHLTSHTYDVYCVFGHFSLLFLVRVQFRFGVLVRW